MDLVRPILFCIRRISSVVINFQHVAFTRQESLASPDITALVLFAFTCAICFDLREALSEVVHGLIQTMNLLSDNIDPEYAEQIVDVLVENAHVIFTVMDFTDHIPLFALQHALKILEVFHEMFEDIPNFELMVELFGRDNPNSLLLPQPLEFDFLMQSDSDSSVDIEEEFI